MTDIDQTTYSLDSFSDLEQQYIQAIIQNPAINRRQLALSLGATEGQINYWYSPRSRVYRYLQQEFNNVHEQFISTQIRAAYKAIIVLEQSLNSDDPTLRFKAAKELAKLSPSLSRTLANDRLKDSQATSTNTDRLVTILTQHNT